ncbi:hypothetical protein [Flagellimonas sp.]|uniref:hypothetical protein n=1 Tax=Flagellimonas sp. TaxID=2058762 RepID=UPI003BA94873
MGLNDLLPQNQKGKNKKSTSSSDGTKRKGPGRPKEKEDPQINFTVYSSESTKELLLRIQDIMSKTENRKVSQGDLVREGLELLAKEMNLEERERKYAKFLKDMS